MVDETADSDRERQDDGREDNRSSPPNRQPQVTQSSAEATKDLYAHFALAETSTHGSRPLRAVPLIDVAIDAVGVVRHPQLLHEPASKPPSVVSLPEHVAGRRTLFCRQAGDMVVCMAYLERQPSRLVLWVAVLTALTAVVSLAMAITTLPHSGPYCRSDCVGYPYSDAAAFVPRDYLWMYPALVLTLLAVVLMESIHHQLALSRGLLSRIAVAFTTMGGAILVVDYAGQLTFLQPALLLGETEGLSPWSQYNPHGIFIALENVGYGLLSFAFLFVGAAMLGTPWKLWPAAGWVFVCGGALVLAALVLYSTIYRLRLEYRFEVAAIGVTWLVLIAAPVLLSIALVRTRPVDDDQPPVLGCHDRDLVERR